MGTILNAKYRLHITYSLPHSVRIGCQRSSSRQNSSFSSFLYCSLADLDSNHFLFYYFDFLPTSFDLAFQYKTPPNAVLLQSMLGCSVGLVLAHPFSGLVSGRLFGLVLARFKLSFSVLNLSYLCLCRLWRWLLGKGPCVCLQSLLMYLWFV
jgi:hypothetical protein